MRNFPVRRIAPFLLLGLVSAGASAQTTLEQDPNARIRGVPGACDGAARGSGAHGRDGTGRGSGAHGRSCPERGSGAHGGDPVTLEFTTIGRYIVQTLRNAGPNAIPGVDPERLDHAIDATEFVALYFQEMPEGREARRMHFSLLDDRIDNTITFALKCALNFPEDPAHLRIEIDAQCWQGLGKETRQALVLHELSGIAGIELDHTRFSSQLGNVMRAAPRIDERAHESEVQRIRQTISTLQARNRGRGEYEYWIALLRPNQTWRCRVISALSGTALSWDNVAQYQFLDGRGNKVNAGLSQEVRFDKRTRLISNSTMRDGDTVFDRLVLDFETMTLYSEEATNRLYSNQLPAVLGGESGGGEEGALYYRVCDTFQDELKQRLNVVLAAINGVISAGTESWAQLPGQPWPDLAKRLIDFGGSRAYRRCVGRAFDRRVLGTTPTYAESQMATALNDLQFTQSCMDFYRELATVTAGSQLERLERARAQELQRAMEQFRAWASGPSGRDAELLSRVTQELNRVIQDTNNELQGSRHQMLESWRCGRLARHGDRAACDHRFYVEWWGDEEVRIRQRILTHLQTVEFPRLTRMIESAR